MAKTKITASPEAVQGWVRFMIQTGRAKEEKELAEKLGITRQALWYMKTHGANQPTDLAMQALATGAPMWSDFYPSIPFTQSP